MQQLKIVVPELHNYIGKVYNVSMIRNYKYKMIIKAKIIYLFYR